MTPVGRRRVRRARPPRSAWVLCAVLIAVLGLAGCASTKSRGMNAPGEVVVRVGRTAITKAMLAHWTAVETVLSYEHKAVHLSRQAYEAVEHHILEILIIDYWTKEEARETGLRATSQEIEQALHREFPTKADFDSLLAGTGERPADKRFLIEYELLTNKLQAKNPQSDGITRNWGALTNCQPGYIVNGCKQYNQHTNTHG
jgi:SurA N-terminal domain